MNSATAQSDREIFEVPSRPLGPMLTAALIAIGPIAGLVATAIAVSTGASLSETIARAAIFTMVAGIGPLILLRTVNNSSEHRVPRLHGRHMLILAAPALVMVPEMLVTFVISPQHVAAPLSGQAVIQTAALLIPVLVSVALCHYGFGIAAAGGDQRLLTQQVMRVRKLASHSATVIERAVFAATLFGIAAVLLAMVFGAARPEHDVLVVRFILLVGASGIGSLVLVQISGARQLRGRLMPAR